MALEMKPACERCETPLPHDGEAWICSYECTWCTPCKEGPLENICPNCGGALEKRPVRRSGG